MRIESCAHPVMLLRLLAVVAAAAVAMALHPSAAMAQEQDLPQPIPDATDACPFDPDEWPYEDRGDIPEVHRSNVDCTSEVQVTLGFVDGTFRPNDPVRRDQMASFVARTLDVGVAGATPLPQPDESDDDFGDIEGNVHADNIRRLHAAGIVEGRTATEYAPARLLNRAQVASFLLRAAAYGAGVDLADLQSDEQAFDDVDEDNTHSGNVNGAAELNLVTGRTATTYDPDGPTMRAQMASTMARLMLALQDGYIATNLFIVPGFDEATPPGEHEFTIHVVAAGDPVEGREVQYEVYETQPMEPFEPPQEPDPRAQPPVGGDQTGPDGEATFSYTFDEEVEEGETVEHTILGCEASDAEFACQQAFEQREEAEAAFDMAFMTWIGG